ncbi:MAG: alpha-xylosidase [Anaerolineales bacterium]|nr:alpha-xylosidase [Anaerolineales bacterium]MDW8277439.1 alpha-xylosidase [Anaerolineales bacterium]
MKFTDGYWEMRPGHTPFYAAQPHEIEITTNALTVYAATKRLVGRGDTLNLPLITVQFSAPMEDVIRVRIIHHKGIRNPGPEFQLREADAPQPVVVNEEQFAALTSGKLSVRIHKGDSWRIEYQAEGRTLTSSGWRSLGFVDTPEGRFIHEQLSLGVGECVYGLGERFTPFVKNGQVVEIWNEDGGTSSELAYKNIPFYLTNRGYGVFVNHPEKVSFEVASEKVERVQFSVPGETLEYFVLYGATPKQVLERYTALTGRPALPPAWSFGLWLSTSFTTNYDEPTVTGFLQEMKARGIPLSVFHFDCFWMKEFRWCDFTWDERCFPDPAGMLRRLKEHGVRICVWINPYIAQRSALFDEAAAAGYLLKKPNGDVWQWDKWQAGMGIVDFTNPAACAWFQSKLRALLEMGVDAFKTDFGERIPTEDVAWFDGSDPRKMHNYYSYLYNKTVFDLLKETRGEGEAVVFARSATAGGQQFPVHWGGDCTATFESMAESLRGGLSLALSGFGFWSHDIGGFEAAPLSLRERDGVREADVYKRWVAFGLLSSHSRLHGSGSYRVPWVYDEEAVAVLAKFTRLKCRLMPYLYRAALQAHERGTPMMRAMMMEFPDDPACETLDRQYMLGDSLLVAPVFSAENEVTYYVPAGRWTNILNRKVVEGPRWVRERHDFFSLPLLARPNSVIPLGFDDERPDYDYSQDITLHIYELEEGQRLVVEIPNARGKIETRFEVRREAGNVTITPQNASKPWKALLVNVREARSIAQLEETPEGILVLPDEPSSEVNLKVTLS